MGMIDKITARIKKYPFQTGILLGCIACLILVGFISLFQDNGRTLSANRDIVREDYLRMAISEYGQNYDSDLAGWRYKHLGRAADATLELMMADESIDPQLLSSFSEAVGKKDVLQNKLNAMGTPGGGTPASPRKGISGFAKTVLVIVGLLVLCAAGFYAASLVKTKQKQKKRSEFNQHLADEPVDMITPEKARMADSNSPDTLFDLDKLFPQKTDGGKNTPAVKKIAEEAADAEEAFEESAAQAAMRYRPAEGPVDDEQEPEAEDAAGEDTDLSDEKSGPAEPFAGEDLIDDGSGSEPDDNAPEVLEDTDTESDENSDEYIPSDEEPEPFSDLEIKTTVYDFGNKIDDADAADEESEPAEDNSTPEDDEQPAVSSDAEESASDAGTGLNAEKPLVETDAGSEPDSEDELLRMIRGAKTTSASVLEDSDEPEPAGETDGAELENEAEAAPFETNEKQEDPNDILIHYQSQYRVGNDMYDEVFSIDQGDTFRGECGIGIGETLNNTEPKAVTAFEVWLFDKDDIHTATWYLMSDFAMSNEGIYDRLQQHGRCEQIRKNAVYVLETETLQVELRVLELEYGTEMDEKNSYFTNVTFDVIARSKQTDL